jgi:hypothetical protein
MSSGIPASILRMLGRETAEEAAVTDWNVATAGIPPAGSPEHLSTINVAQPARSQDFATIVVMSRDVSTTDQF